MNIYPNEYPKPLVKGYSIDVDMGLIRTPFETGRARQRRSYKTMPHLFGFTFVVGTRELYNWLSWVNSYAYDWFQLDMTSFLTGNNSDSGYCSAHAIRFASNIRMTAIDQKHFEISVTAEMVDPLNSVIIAALGSWIIGGEPLTPSADYIVAGEPDSPSLDQTNPGSPQFPAVDV